MNKKGTTILLVGFVFFLVMTMLAVVVWEAVDKLDFDKHAGIDAQILSENQYTSNMHIYYMTEILKEFNKSTFTLTEFSEYMKTQNEIPYTSGPIIENEFGAYYSMYSVKIHDFFTMKFNEKYQEFAEKYNAQIFYDEKESNSIKPSQFSLENQEYSILITEDTLVATAKFPEILNSQYYFYPNALLHNSAFAKKVAYLESPIRAKIRFQECLIATKEENPYKNCSERIAEEISIELNTPVEIRASDVNERIRLQITFENAAVFWFEFLQK